MAATEGTSLKCLHGECESISGWLDAFQPGVQPRHGGFARLSLSARCVVHMAMPESGRLVTSELATLVRIRLAGGGLVVVGARDIPGAIDGPTPREVRPSRDPAEECQDSDLGASTHGGTFMGEGHC